MFQIFMIDFEFEGVTYYALIRVQNRNQKQQYYVTVMNGNLERQLYGHHILTETNGTFAAQVPASGEVQKILSSVIGSIEKHREQLQFTTNSDA
jgi:hypothetical protein